MSYIKIIITSSSMKIITYHVALYKLGT